jgi:hypothetical protein
MMVDAAHDASLAYLATADRVDICVTDPAVYGDIAAATRGNYTLTPGDGNGDWVIGNGDVSGRKLTLQAQTGNNATGDGDANFLAFSVGTTLLFTIPGDGDTLNNGSPVTIAATNVHEIRDPA